MKHRFFVQSAIVLTLLFISLTPARGQSFMSQAQSNGFTLKKVVSDTAIATGQNFSYTIYFSIPAGATSITITDVLPANLSFQSINTSSVCGSPTVTAPPVNSMGGTVTLTWASVPGGCSGSFVITVQFPNGITCNGTTARNRVCMQGDVGTLKADFCTGYVSTRAIAVDPWNIGKWVVGAGTQPGPCPYVTADSIVTYQICVWKNVGITGQLNMFNAVVYDTLPAGATLVSSSCGATQTGNVISWSIGALNALPMYNTVCCSFQVLYPKILFPNGTQITNRATLHGTLGSQNSPCGPAVHPSNQTCVEIKQVTSATFSKYVYTNGQPGCSGKYQIWVCNNGTLPITSMTITDTIPAPPLTGIALGAVSPGLNASLSGNIVTVTLSSPLLPAQCRYFEVTFTIPSGATVGSTITNCAWMQIIGTAPQKACASFVVTAPAPKPCLWKEVCNKQTSYSPGDTLRYRLRVQNIGGLPITGASITDVLNPNLQYIGNPSYYTAASWNVPCQSTSNWTGVSFSQSGNTLTFALPTIPATCQSIFYNSCGMYGTPGVPFYFIEFDVKVTDTSALGNIPNNFTISGGSLTGPTLSNTDLINVIGTTGFLLDKSVAKDTTSWASSTTVTPGSNVNYRLRLTVAPGSVGLRHITFADLLPRDNGALDQLILPPCSPRSSTFDVSYVATISSSPTATGYNNPLSLATVNNFAPIGSPGNMFIGGCGTLGTWSPGLSVGNKNLGAYFGPTPVAAGNSATGIYTVSVPSSAVPPGGACNTFAANAAVRHLINSTIISDQQIGQLESQQACITLSEDTTAHCEIKLQLKSVVSAGVNPTTGLCDYTVTLTATNSSGSPIPTWLDSFQGIVTPPTLTIPVGTSTQTVTFTDTPPTDTFVCIRYGIFDSQGLRIVCDSVCFDVPPCGGQSDLCDSLSVQFKNVTATGVDATGNCTYSVDLSVTNASINPITAWFESLQGTVSPASVTLPVGTSTQTFTFIDTPPPDTLVCIRFGIFIQGQKRICDSVCFKLPPCGDHGDLCDSLSIKATSVTSGGVDPAGNCITTLVVSVTNTSASPITTWFASYQGSVTPATLTLPVGTSSQTLTFIDTPPTNTFACIRYGIFDIQGQRIVCDSVCFDVPQCQKKCDSLINQKLDDCCTYHATIVNGSGSPITSISYYITNGTVNSFVTAPCTPLAPAPVGSTSGVLAFSPACPGSPNFSFNATPIPPTAMMFVTLVVHHANGDSCMVRFQYKCDKKPPVKCDDIKVKPVLFPGLNISGRTFTVYNFKVPASPITHIDIVRTPTPCIWQGGALTVDFTPTSWTLPYTRIPTSGFISANTQVQFNVGVDYSCNWTGTITLVIHHADGDSCISTYGLWKALPPNPGGGTIWTQRITKRVYANKLQLQNTSSTPVKWVSVNVIDSEDVIVAGSGAHWHGTTLEPQYAVLDGYEQGQSEGLFSFESLIPVNGTSGFFNLVVARDSAKSAPPVIRWVTYDGDGNAIATDTVRITGPVLSVRGDGGSVRPDDFELLQFFPNPNTHSATINYLIGQPMNLRLELFNHLGEHVAVIDEGFKPGGMHTVRYNTSQLPAGGYYLRLSSETNQIIKQMVIVR